MRFRSWVNFTRAATRLQASSVSVTVLNFHLLRHRRQCRHVGSWAHLPNIGLSRLPCTPAVATPSHSPPRAVCLPGGNVLLHLRRRRRPILVGLGVAAYSLLQRCAPLHRRSPGLMPMGTRRREMTVPAWSILPSGAATRRL